MLKITIIAMGNKMPTWVLQAIREFTVRLQDSLVLSLIEIPLLRRGKQHDLPRILDKEMQLMQQHMPEQAYLVALDVQGRTFSSEQLAAKLQQLQHATSHVCFLLGGPEGIAARVLASCQEKWSLSTLTLPHTLARVVLLEALYRSVAILNHHPYHK